MPKYTEVVNRNLVTHCLVCGRTLVSVLCRLGDNAPYMQWRTEEELAGSRLSCEHEVL
jgi:hypothetical protein